MIGFGNFVSQGRTHGGVLVGGRARGDIFELGEMDFDLGN